MQEVDSGGNVSSQGYNVAKVGKREWGFVDCSKDGGLYTSEQER